MHNGHNHDDNSAPMNWSALLAGAFLGAGVALLIAPQRGTELRSKLRDYANRATDDLQEKALEAWDTAVERGKEYYDKGEEVVLEAGQSQENLPNRDSRRAGQSIKEFA